MDELLTKARLLEGIERREQVHIDVKGREQVHIENLAGPVEIRPLTSAQWAEAQAISSEPLTISENRKGDYIPTVPNMRAAMTAAHKSTLYVVRMGLTEGWTDAELSKLPAGAIEELENAILKLSGVSRKPEKQRLLEAAVQSFREEAPGDGDTPPAQPTPGTEPIGDDTTTS